MTRFLAGAIGLILIAAVALLLGWIGANETFIWISIIGSAAAAVLIALAFAQGRALTTSTPKKPRRKKAR
jgi:hypothetical protein